MSTMRAGLFLVASLTSITAAFPMQEHYSSKGKALSTSTSHDSIIKTQPNPSSQHDALLGEGLQWVANPEPVTATSSAGSESSMHFKSAKTSTSTKKKLRIFDYEAIERANDWEMAHLLPYRQHQRAAKIWKGRQNSEKVRKNLQSNPMFKGDFTGNARRKSVSEIRAYMKKMVQIHRNIDDRKVEDWQHAHLLSPDEYEYVKTVWKQRSIEEMAKAEVEEDRLRISQDPNSATNIYKHLVNETVVEVQSTAHSSLHAFDDNRRQKRKRRRIERIIDRRNDWVISQDEIENWQTAHLLSFEDFEFVKSVWKERSALEIAGTNQEDIMRLKNDEHSATNIYQRLLDGPQAEMPTTPLPEPHHASKSTQEAHNHHSRQQQTGNVAPSSAFPFDIPPHAPTSALPSHPQEKMQRKEMKRREKTLFAQAGLPPLERTGKKRLRWQDAHLLPDHQFHVVESILKQRSQDERARNPTSHHIRDPHSSTHAYISLRSNYNNRLLQDPSVGG